MLVIKIMKSLILFFLNIHSVYSNFISPTVSSQFYAKNNYTIEWNYPLYNDNITHIFLTHGNPFIISKYVDNRIILESQINMGQQNFNWHIPFELNNYNISDINWRLLLSNTSTPYSGSIGSHTENNLIILSDYFKINSNMNISFLSSIPIYSYENNTILANGYSAENNTFLGNLKFYLNNNSENVLLDTLENPILGEIMLGQNVDIFLESIDDDLYNGNNPMILKFIMKQMENMFNYPNIQIEIEQGLIKRNTNTIPIFYIHINEIIQDNSHSQIITNCINSLLSPCIYNLHIVYNGLETVIENQTNSNYNLIKYPGSYSIFATQTGNNNLVSNVLSFAVTTTQTTTPSSTASSTLTTILHEYTTSIITGNPNTDTNTTCTSDNCEDEGFPLLNVIAGVLAGIFFILALYYICIFYKDEKKRTRVHPSRSRLDLESGVNRTHQNRIYETNLNDINSQINKRCLINDTPTPPATSHFYPKIDNLYGDPIDSSQQTVRPRSGSRVNNAYYPTTPHQTNIPTSNENIYYDNYGNKRQIKRRHSSSSYGYTHDYHGDMSERRDPGWYARLVVNSSSNNCDEIARDIKNYHNKNQARAQNEYNILDPNRRNR